MNLLLLRKCTAFAGNTILEKKEAENKSLQSGGWSGEKQVTDVCRIKRKAEVEVSRRGLRM